MFRGEPISVINVSELVGASMLDTTREVIVIQVESAVRIGLLVESLGSIPEVPTTSILPLSTHVGRGRAQIIDRAVRPDSPDDPVLLIMNVEELLAAVRAPAGEIVPI
jgi:chemotaxis signal transduction protein